MKTDVTVQYEGTVFLFHALTRRARRWIEAYVAGGETTWFGNVLVVEHRYAGEIARGMAESGLRVKGGSS